MTTNSKDGRVPSTDPAPGLPAAGRVFGESPVTGKHPNPARSDAATEKDNLRDASAPTPLP